MLRNVIFSSEWADNPKIIRIFELILEDTPIRKTQNHLFFCSFNRIFAPIEERKDMDISRDILQFLHYHPLSSRDEIARGTAFEGSDATMKRLPNKDDK